MSFGAALMVCATPAQPAIGQQAAAAVLRLMGASLGISIAGGRLVCDSRQGFWVFTDKLAGKSVAQDPGLS